jgi:hypothetical protein
MKELGHDTRRSGQDSDLTPFKYKTEALPFEPTCRVTLLDVQIIGT